MPDSETSETYRVQVLERAFHILDAVAGAAGGMGLPDLSETVGLHKSTVHRLVVVLERHRYLEKNSAGRYRLGTRLLELGSRVAAGLELSELARPFLQTLVRETGETAHLGVLRYGEVVSVTNIASSRTLQTPSTVGRHSSAHSSSLGKCLLTGLSDKELADFVRTRGLKGYTPRTITRLGGLKAELRVVREKGFAVDDEEFEEGLRCIGAPVVDHSGAVVAAISIAGPATRLAKRRIPVLARSVVRAAAGLSAALGHERVQPAG